ncbi:MAG: DUF3040 domain-containing protein [Jatrophihabitans sp.]
MPMTDDERRSLDEIAGAMGSTDADLERALSTGRLRNRRLHGAGTCFVAASFACLTTAVVVQQQLLCLGAWLVFVTGMLLRSSAD